MSVLDTDRFRERLLDERPVLLDEEATEPDTKAA